MSFDFKPKSFLRPESENEASDLLRKFGEKGRIIAGGTGIYEVSHRGLLSEVDTLIDISGLGLDKIKFSDGRSLLSIGSCVTMSDLMASKEIAVLPELSAIVDALVAIQPIQVKNVATIGGAICTALPFFDLPVALCSLDASIVISPTGIIQPITDFIQGYFAIHLFFGEFVREIRLKLSTSSVNGRTKIGSAFKKFALTGDDWAIINSGVKVVLDEDGTIMSANISIGGGIGEKPVMARKTSDSIVGIRFPEGETTLGKLIETNLGLEIEPISDIRASSGYRMKIAKIMCKRAILQACARAMMTI